MVEGIKITLSNEEGNLEGVSPEVIGKPNPFSIDLIMREHNILKKDKIIMIGDRPDTDMLYGLNGNIKKCLVMTGVVDKEEKVNEWIKKDIRFKPDYIMNSIGVLE